MPALFLFLAAFAALGHVLVNLNAARLRARAVPVDPRHR
jgi:hypothetical protein